jgi:MoxR-like ATPase
MTPDQAQYFAQRFEAVVSNVERFIQGKDDVVRLALIALLAEGHLLMEDVPGTGKTSLARSLSASLGLSGSRVQFTPDLLPSDVTGVTVFHQSKDTFEFHPGPVFANIVLADEINRASPKTQSAMLEVMAERTVTVDGRSHAVPRPFLVIATQNPVDMDGTYPLPEAQLDRFMMRISVGYPAPAAETQILKNSHEGRRLEDLRAVSNIDEVAGMIKAAGSVHIADSVLSYIVGVITATRHSAGVRLGSSPRGGLALMAAARVRAASRARHYVTPEDVGALIQPVLAHRLVLSPEAIAGGATAEHVLGEATRGVPVPQP